ncbi:MotE family protein [Sulfitobacter aestuariivivens]|uniref:Magnesium transporter MgtE intracellular domain-containing protein n=1 Tax=Sulfitobacter aestuariivivens TaxID=2766981 RepID=A0A927D7C0_9RHOB|nr:hypothetical protein [Sulfitobacter aestuariivivens]MBD3665518.1 hypothetical protein [Sulfitobacter aestuariivivens]
MSRSGKSSRFRRYGRGSVMLIAGFLISSAVLRLASGVANAQDTDVAARPLPAEVKTPVPGVPILMAKGASDRAEMGSLLEALQVREARLLERERTLAERKKALLVADAEIAQRLVSLKAAEEALRQTLSLADGAAEDDLARLTSVYESMKPKEAAALFETMEPAFAAGFLGRMRPDIAATVLAGLSPERAYSISVILAGRNASVPKT